MKKTHWESLTGFMSVLHMAQAVIDNLLHLDVGQYYTTYMINDCPMFLCLWLFLLEMQRMLSNSQMVSVIMIVIR